MNDQTARFGELICPRCGKTILKSWTALSADEKYIAARQPASAQISKEQRRRRLFCTNCWFETGDTEART